MEFYNKSIHTKAQLIKSVLGSIEMPFFKINGYLNKHDLIVLNYHSTPLKFKDNFEKQINFYQAHFSIISPNDLKNFYANKLESKKPKLLITFDDGLSNNKYALQILDKYKIKALLFIVPDFIAATQQKEYYTTHIRNEINPFIDSQPEDFTALSWNELKEIIANGHLVGSHTMSHTLKANTSDNEVLNREITTSKNSIESQLNISVENFSAPFNSLFSVGEKEMSLIIKNYNYFHSTFPGSNYLNKNNYFIKRFNVECFWTIPNIIHTLGHIERFRWRKARLSFEKLLKNSMKQFANVPMKQ
jgi:peptidoglycan/xylan/chitin deacetylase (PgdA/CDA1 family)